MHKEDLHDLYGSGDQLEEIEIYETCSMHGRDGNTKFWSENLKERGQS